MNFWTRISGNGVAGLTGEDARKTRLLNQCAMIAFATNLVFTAGYWVDVSAYRWALVANIVSAMLHLGEFFLVRANLRKVAVALFLLNCNAQIAVVAHMLGPQVGFHYYFFVFAAVVFVVTPRSMAFCYPFAGLSMFLALYFSMWMEQSQASIQVDPMLAQGVTAVTIITTIGTVVVVTFLSDSDTRHAEKHLEREHARSERLLLNILPPVISARLKDGEETIADGFQDVTVLFADIVGFTELSSKMPPADLVRVLNDVFSAFDELADELGLEKIKTIGDAYMVAAGLPEVRKDHAEVMVKMGLGMRDAVAALNEKKGLSLAVRIGIHSGPVVAGIIGKRKFSYDLWGDTVNTASRMESHGEKNRVHVSARTAELVGDAFKLEERGPISVKGKGEMRTFFVA